MVSNPKRAAISAAARVSAAVGASPVTSEALTKSGTSSPFVSRTRPPTSNRVVRSPATETAGACASPASGTPMHSPTAIHITAEAVRITGPCVP